MGRRSFLRSLPPLIAVGCRPARRHESRAGAAVSVLVPAAESQVWAPLAAAFERSQGGSRVTLVEGPTSTDLRESLYTASLLAADDSFDLVLMDVTWSAKFAAAGWLQPLEQWFSAEDFLRFVPAALDAGRFRGRVYRLPTRTDVGVLYYRRDWLEEAGVEPPATFAELAAAARRLQEPPGRWGFVWPGSQYEGLVCFYLEVLRGFGGFWIDEPSGDVGLENRAAVEALEFLRGARFIDPITPPGVTTYKEEESRRLFQDGRAVFLRNWPYVWRLSQTAGSPLVGKVGVRAVPTVSGAPGQGTLGGWGLGISRYSRNPEKAAGFIRYATSLNGQRLLCRTSGYVPATVAGLDDSDLSTANPFLATLRTILPSAVPRPRLPRYAVVSDILQRRLSACLAGLVDAPTALRSAATETRRALHPASGANR